MEKISPTAHAPRNPTEEKIVEIFRNVLQLGAVGIDDDFFDWEELAQGVTRHPPAQ